VSRSPRASGGSTSERDGGVGGEPSSASAPLDPTIMHVDMDAFFAAVELLDRPELVGRPVIVGGSGARGVVASCTYEARRFGVHSAMPSSRARALCPDAVFLDGRHDRYGEVSAQLREVFLSVTPLVEPIGLDEAFLDVTGSKRLLGRPEVIARGIRERVYEELSLRCSVGVGRSKLIAKLASRAAKPVVSSGGVQVGDGVRVVLADQETAFLTPLKVEALWGVGPATARQLHSLGIRTVGELADVDPAVLMRHLGSGPGAHLADLAAGRDPSPVVPQRAAKSLGHEETFPRDLFDPQDLRARLVRIADSLADVLAHHQLRGRTVTLKVRFADFTTLTRAHTLSVPLDAGPAIAEVAVALLDSVDLVSGVRLLGVSLSGLQPADLARQLSFDLGHDGASHHAAATQAAWEDVSAAVAGIRERFGRSAVRPASTMRTEKRGPWGPAAQGEATPPP
jgi:DNA polymerase IV